MKRSIIYILTAFLLSLFLPRCEKDLPGPNGNDTTGVISEATKYINNWIWDVMNEVYYWSVNIPQNLDPNEEADPEIFFRKLLYSKDRFSWLDDDYEGLMDRYYGVVKSMGYSPSFGRYSNTDGIFILVEYIFPESPADRAGLKRGDIIVSINGIDLDIDNYIILFNLDIQTVTLGVLLEDGIAKTDTKLSMTSEVLALDPSIYYEIKEIGDHKIGYLVYVEFTAGKYDEYLNSLGTIFDTFSVSGITDLIVDLRYNPGGTIEAAGFLAAAIAPASIVRNHEVLVRFEYNSLYKNYFLREEGPDSENLVLRFKDNPHNINLSRVYFLTTSGTASACEFTISGLYPYMDVVLVGQNTYGKYTGAWIIPDLADPHQHNYALVPVVMKYANAEGYTDFNDGLSVDIEVEDDLMLAAPFGNLNDQVFYKALEAIVGTAQMPAKKKAVQPVPYELLENKIKESRRNLFIDPVTISK
jgi:carboxyl-terminal processing protease